MENKDIRSFLGLNHADMKAVENLADKLARLTPEALTLLDKAVDRLKVHEAQPAAEPRKGRGRTAKSVVVDGLPPTDINGVPWPEAPRVPVADSIHDDHLIDLKSTVQASVRLRRSKLL